MVIIRSLGFVRLNKINVFEHIYCLYNTCLCLLGCIRGFRTLILLLASCWIRDVDLQVVSEPINILFVGSGLLFVIHTYCFRVSGDCTVFLKGFNWFSDHWESLFVFLAVILKFLGFPADPTNLLIKFERYIFVRT